MKTILRKFVRFVTDSVIYIESFLYVRKKKSAKSKHRVLIMRKDGLGDCIIFYPTLKAYREYYADADITLIFPTYFKDLAPLLSKDLVDNVIWFDHKAFGSQFSYRRKFLLDLKRGGYDIFIYPVFTRETIGSFMMKMTGAQEKIGFKGDISERGARSEAKGMLTYTRLIEVPQTMVSEIERDAFFAEAITGKKVSISFPTIDIRKLSDEKASQLMNKNNLTNKKYVVMFPGAGVAFRIWMTENFAAIADYLASKGITVVISGSSKEKELAKDIISKSVSGSNIIDLSGQTDLATLAHILKRSLFYFGSDTGILHLAVAVGTPAIAIVGMGGLDRFFPYGDHATNRAVYDKTRSYITGRWNDAHLLKPGEIHPSIKNITVADTVKEIDFLLQNESVYAKI